MEALEVAEKSMVSLERVVIWWATLVDEWRDQVIQPSL